MGSSPISNTMITISEILDTDNLTAMIEQGYITQRYAPELPLCVLNYTPACAWDQFWNTETLTCRGLVYDIETNEIFGRPFPKFFNLSQYLDSGKLLPNEPFTVSDKMDGSLIVAYKYKKSMVINTRGSFESNQAQMACIWAEEHFPENMIPFGETWLFEWIGPSNRIVVNYPENKLVLLDIIQTDTGNSIWNINYNLPPWFPVGNVAHDHIVKDIHDLIGIERENKEGYVVKYQSGLRLKIKHDEYTRLHRILTNVSPKTIWRYLAEDDVAGRDAVIDNVPDEFYDWVMNQENYFRAQAQEIESKVRGQFLNILKEAPDSRREFAELALKSKNSSMLFTLLDKNYDKFYELIWKQIKPVGTQPFKEDVDV